MPPKKTRVNGSARKLPGIKHKAPASRTNFDSDDSDASDDARPGLRLSQTLLGSHNSLKQLLSGSQPQETPKKVPARRGRPPKKPKAPESPQNTATTPISRLRHATALLVSPNESSNIRFEDIEVPRRRGRPKGSKTKPKAVELPKKRKLTKLNGDDDQLFNTDEDPIKASKRRTSYNHRGNRVLSIGNGFVAKPHSEVSEKEYYKLLNTLAPEPSQMRQLLVWCFKKLEQEKEIDSGESETAKGIAKVIKKELLNDLIDGTISTSWYSRRDDVEQALSGKRIIRPNPLNESNRENVEIFTRKLHQLEAEKQTWRKAFASSVKLLEGLEVEPVQDTQRLEEYLKKKNSDIAENVLLGKLVDKVLKNADRVQRCVPRQLEEWMDRLYHTLHQLTKGVELAASYEQDQLAAQAAQLVHKYMSNRQSHITSKELLRGISRLDNPKSRT